MVFAIVLLTLAAWLPSLQPYVPAAEDYGRGHVADPSAAGYWAWLLAHSYREGLWRVIGLPFTSVARNLHPLGFPILSIMFHAVNGILIAVMLLRLRSSRFIAAVAALIFVTLPSAVEANMYAVASQSMQATTIFLVLACYLAAALERDRLSPASLLFCFVVALIGNATQENLLFASVVLPAAIAFVHRPVRQWNRAYLQSVLAYSVCTTLATAVYASTTLSVRTDPTKAIDLNFAALLSFPMYQYTNLIPFDLWNHLDLVGLAIRHQSPIVAIISALLLVAGVLVARRTIADVPDESADAVAREWRLLGAVLAMWHVAGWIYVLAGGYSLESRKKYAGLMFLAVIVAVVVVWLVRGSSARATRHGAFALASGAVAIAATTTWLISTLWVLEARRGAVLMDTIAAQPELTDVRVRFVPDLYRTWRRWRYLASSQHNAEWVTIFEADRRFNRTIQIAPETAITAPAIECHFVGSSAECEFFDGQLPSQ
jgi:hypothetical protein